MKLIDLHCDTFSRMYEKNILDFNNNDLHINLSKLKKADSFIQVFALFDEKDKFNYEIEKYNELINFAHNMIDKNKDKINFVEKYDDINNKEKQNIILSNEDMGSVNSNFNNIKYYYDKGIRMAALTWNYENCIGYPNTMDQNLGLKKFGKEAVEYMNELGIIVDVSHLNDKGFYDVYDISKCPFIASHSCARSLCDHSRNLTDDMIRKIADRGGVIGINFYSLFLRDINKDTKEKMVELIKQKDFSSLDNLMSGLESKNEDIIKHIEYIKNIGGSDVIALGSDFDGISCKLEMHDCSGIPTLIPLLEKKGFNIYEIEKLFYRNALRVFKDII